MVKTVLKYRYRCEVIAANGRASQPSEIQCRFSGPRPARTEIAGDGAGRGTEVTESPMPFGL
jgi:hypothetical protein